MIHDECPVSNRTPPLSLNSSVCACARQTLACGGCTGGFVRADMYALAAPALSSGSHDRWHGEPSATGILALELLKSLVVPAISDVHSCLTKQTLFG